jgi:hypothetical protein
MIRNERHFAEWFKENFDQFGFSGIVRGDIGVCPDFIMLRAGNEVKVELETRASNFVVHKHSLDDVDEIICLVNDLEKPILVAKNVKYALNRKVTLSIDEDIYKEFGEFCRERGFKLSKMVENVMITDMEKLEKVFGGKR